MSASQAERQRYAKAIADNWADKGKVMAGGWAAYRYLFLKDVPEDQQEQLRRAFFLGAEHLFSTVMLCLDPENEPTDRDMARLAALHQELEAFKLELASHHPPARDQ